MAGGDFSGFRSWTSCQGTASQPAKLVSLSDDQVKLEFEDGRQTDLVISQLCEDDREFLAAAKNKTLTDITRYLEGHGFNLRGSQIRFQCERDLKRCLRELSANKNQIKKVEKQLERVAEASSQLDQERFRLRQVYVDAQRAVPAARPQNIDQRNRAIGMLNAITAQIESFELKAKAVRKETESLRGELAMARSQYLLSAQELKRQLSILKRKQDEFNRLKMLDKARSLAGAFVSDLDLSQPIHGQRRNKLLADLNSSILSSKIPLRVVGNTKNASVLINGQPVEMILDTGASLVTLPSSVAAQAGIVAKPGDPDIQLSVADGKIITAKMVDIESVQLGPFQVQGVRCAVLSPRENNAVALLGMSFLGNFEMKLLHDSVELTQVSPGGVVASEE